jgi:hypothetical protein
MSLLKKVATVLNELENTMSNLVKSASLSDLKEELKAKAPKQWKDLKLVRTGPGRYETAEGYVVSSLKGIEIGERANHWSVFAPEQFKDFNGNRRLIYTVSTLEKAKYWIVRHMRGLEG